jgi:hypothetical protein
MAGDTDSRYAPLGWARFWTTSDLQNNLHAIIHANYATDAHRRHD